MDDTNKFLASEMIGIFDRFIKIDWGKKENLGIRPSEVRVLLCIKQLTNESDHGVSISDISKKLIVTSPSVTQVTKQLVEYGYVESVSDSKDKRITLLRLTNSGEDFTQRAWGRVSTHFTGLIDRLGEEKSTTLIMLLEEVYEYSKEAKEFKS